MVWQQWLFLIMTLIAFSVKCITAGERKVVENDAQQLFSSFVANALIVWLVLSI